MDDNERKRLEFLQALRLRQDTAVGAASDVWGYVNEAAGADLLEKFAAEGKIQSFVLAARGSYLDEEGVDAALHLWNQSYLPINFKSSEWGKRKHEEVPRRYRIPCLVVNKAEDPDFLRSSVDLAHLIDTWHGSFSFYNDMLVPCVRLTPWSDEHARLREEVSDILLLLMFARVALGGCVLSGVEPLNCARRKYAYVHGRIALSTGKSVEVEFYRGSRIISWVGKRNVALTVLPKAFTADELRLALETGLKKAKKI